MFREVENAACDMGKYPLSVVIATLGGDVLRDTIRHLNEGECIPAEILVCIPNEEASQLSPLAFSNVQIVPTPCRGQVAQRAYGLKRVSQPLVLQMDDDIELQSESLRVLVETLGKLGPKHALAPVFRHRSTKQYITEYRSGFEGWIRSLYATLICGAPWGIRRMGHIAPAGIGYAVDRRRCGQAPVETEWLPGGCVLCQENDLVLESYYPFSGKAYSEDLIHSVLWRRQGVRLMWVPTAECSTDVAPMPFHWAQMLANARAHAYVARLINGQTWRTWLWFGMYATKQFILIWARKNVALLSISRAPRKNS